jgi:hypothetical protein
VSILNIQNLIFGYENEAGVFEFNEKKYLLENENLVECAFEFV